MPIEPDTRRQLAKQARLWALSFICAAIGAATVWRTNMVPPGIGAFLIALAVLGTPLWLYERRHRAPDQRPTRPRR